MNSINIPFKAKKIPYYLLISLLTAGAGLILGFLSFGGMFALYPILPLAFAAFGLSVVYEGEIYLQNIKNAYKKLFKDNYLKNYLGKEFLLKNFPDNDEDNCPKFFKDYLVQLKLLENFNHKNLNSDSKKRKKKIEKTLKHMEKWFALQLFSDENNTDEQTEYSKELTGWLQEKQTENTKKTRALLESRRKTFYAVKAFSVLSAVFMGFGTTYLIVEAFSVIPFIVAAIPFALWPVIIVPMAFVAGLAYGMLTYNAVTDFINNNTIKKWYSKIRDDFKQGLTVRNVILAIAAVVLTALAIALTVCTAGTWWTIATKARPLFDWMRKIPSYVMGIINPIITGLSALIFILENTGESLELFDDWMRKISRYVKGIINTIITGLSALIFNLENTGESLELVDEVTKNAGKGNFFTKIADFFRDSMKHIRATENWLQILNPFRIIAKLTITPLRILLFIGHLIGIAVTADRVPGVPQIVAALIAFISEGFEDGHYFFTNFFPHNHDDHHEGHHHEGHDAQDMINERLESAHGHSHDEDIPTRLLFLVAHVLYVPATLWDWLASKLNTPAQHKTLSEDANQAKSRQVLSLKQAWHKQRGTVKEQDVQIDATAKKPSVQWQVEHTVLLIEKHKAKNLNGAIFGKSIAKEKISELDKLKVKIRESNSKVELSNTLNQALDNESSYNKHRIFSQSNEKTTTTHFVEQLPAMCGG